LYFSVIVSPQIAEYVPYTSFDSDKVKSTLKQIVRDWSKDGEPERKLSYQPIIDEITSRLPASVSEVGTSVLC